jgi:hypothetical protein
MWWKCYLLTYDNGRMRPVATFPGREGGDTKEIDEEGKLRYDM